MTPAQQARHEKLRNAVTDAYDRWNKNTSRDKNEKLHNAWLKAIEKCEAFEEKYF